MYEWLHHTKFVTTEFHHDVDNFEKCNLLNGKYHIKYTMEYAVPEIQDFVANSIVSCVFECRSVNYITE